MALNMDDLDGMDDEELIRLLEQFMSELGGVQGIDVNKVGDGDIELFEELMRQAVLPHLIGPGGLGDIKNIKVLKVRNPNFGRDDDKPSDPDSDTSWLDKYLK